MAKRKVIGDDIPTVRNIDGYSRAASYTQQIGLAFVGDDISGSKQEIALERVLLFGRAYRNEVMKHSDEHPNVVNAKRLWELSKARFEKEFPGALEALAG